MNRKLNWFAGLMAFSALAAHAVSADEAKALGTDADRDRRREGRQRRRHHSRLQPAA
jgi:hypothetical protein